MRKLITILTLIIGTGEVRLVRADIFGGDVAVLTQILVNEIQQLSTLSSVLQSSKDTLGILNEVNRGIHQAVRLIRTIDPHWNPGIYQDWQTVEKAIQEMERIYGEIPSTSEAKVQKDLDQSVAEAVTLNNSIYQYTREIDKVGEEVKAASQIVSPAGAQKLTAETLGVLLHVMNSSLRAQATGLKLQAQALAVQNRQEKAQTRHSVQVTQSVQSALAQRASFSLPRF